MKHHHLRPILWAIAAFIVVASMINFALGGRSLIGAGIAAAVIVIALTVEADRYKPKVEAHSGDWHATGEAFVDTATGKHVHVFFNPKTGQRDYRHAR